MRKDAQDGRTAKDALSNGLQLRVVASAVMWRPGECVGDGRVSQEGRGLSRRPGRPVGLWDGRPGTKPAFLKAHRKGPFKVMRCY